MSIVKTVVMVTSVSGDKISALAVYRRGARWLNTLNYFCNIRLLPVQSVIQKRSLILIGLYIELSVVFNLVLSNTL